MTHRLTNLLAIALALLAASARAEPETVYFKSADGATEIVGYLFKPAGTGPHPAIVSCTTAPGLTRPMTTGIAPLSRAA
jgi:carboxymethylenebutenolidase